MFRWSLSLLLLGSCGRFGFGSHDGPSDASDDGSRDGAGSDAALAICHTGTFGAPQPISSLATGSEESDPSVSPDELTLYFESNRNGGQARSLWVARRASRALPFENPTLIAELDSAVDDGEPEIADDGLTLYYASRRGGTLQVFSATRPDLAATFNDQGQLPINGNPATTNVGPSVTSDELTLFFAANGLDIAFATRPDRTAQFAFQRTVTEINSAPTDASPTISADGLELFFNTYRDGPDVIYTAQRATTSDAFSTPTAMNALDPGGFGAGSPELSADGRTLYYYITDGSQLDLFTVTRSCP